MKDLIWVWIGSIAGGLSAGGLVILKNAACAYLRGQHQFKAAEEPLDFLKRLTKKIGKSLKFPFVRIDGRRLYRLDPREAGSTVWAAPAIRFFPNDKGFDATEIADAVRSDDLNKLIEVLGKFRGSGVIKLEWDNFGHVYGPTIVPIDSFAGLDPQILGPIFQETPADV